MKERANRNYKIKIFENFDSRSSLKNFWEECCANSGPYTAFLCYDWFFIWQKNFLGTEKILIMVLFENEKPVCIAPFIKKRERLFGIYIRKIELMGNVYSPFRYFVLNKKNVGERVYMLSLLFGYLSKNYRNWDIIDCFSMPEENNMYKVVVDAAITSGFSYKEYFSFGDWYMKNINCSGEQYVENLPKKIRKDIKYCLRRLEREGDLKFNLIECTKNNINKFMDLYYLVYSNSWQKEEGVGPTFHRDLAEIAEKNGWLRLGFLMFNGIAIASQFWINCFDSSFILKTIYDQKYKKYSPGKILTMEMFKSAIDKDLSQIIDYAQGDEPYKKDWTPERRERKGLKLYNNNIKGKILILIETKMKRNLAKSIFQKLKYLKNYNRAT